MPSRWRCEEQSSSCYSTKMFSIIAGYRMGRGRCCVATGMLLQSISSEQASLIPVARSAAISGTLSQCQTLRRLSIAQYCTFS